MIIDFGVDFDFGRVSCLYGKGFYKLVPIKSLIKLSA